jgi:hypothetical protein
MKTKVRLAIDLFLLAEDFNREEETYLALNLKMEFKDYMQSLTKKEQKLVTEYLDSVGA